MADTSDSSRTPAQIEADIRRRRETLAETLDEIGVRVHPKTIVGDVKGQFVDVDGAPRLERIVPVALVVVGLVGVLALGTRRRKG